MIEAAWKYDERDRCWILMHDYACVHLAHRPHYCDRGRWIAVVSGVGNLDRQDDFPRYFMDLDRAKAEMAEWLGWRVRVNGAPSVFDEWRAKALAVDELTLAVSAIERLSLMNPEQEIMLRAVLGQLRARYGSAME